MSNNGKTQRATTSPFQVVFYRTDSGNEPVREWLKSLEREARKAIGEDVKTIQFGWPLGMPLVRKLEPHLWEVRSHIATGIARVLFTVVENQYLRQSKDKLQICPTFLARFLGLARVL